MNEACIDEIGCREIIGRMLGVIVLAICAAVILSGCTRLTYKDGDTKATYTALQNPFFIQSPEASYTPSNGTFNVKVKRASDFTEEKIKVAIESAMKKINPVP